MAKLLSLFTSLPSSFHSFKQTALAGALLFRFSLRSQSLILRLLKMLCVITIIAPLMEMKNAVAKAFLARLASFSFADYNNGAGYSFARCGSSFLYLFTFLVTIPLPPGGGRLFSPLSHSQALSFISLSTPALIFISHFPFAFKATFL